MNTCYKYGEEIKENAKETTEIMSLYNYFIVEITRNWKGTERRPSNVQCKNNDTNNSCGRNKKNNRENSNNDCNNSNDVPNQHILFLLTRQV